MINQTMLVGVTTDSHGNHRLQKPEDPGEWQNYYSIDDTGLVIRVMWGKKDPPRPVRLYFSSTDKCITAVGFSECESGVEPHTATGPCGGCFFLETEITGEQKVAVVANWGYQRKDDLGYYFSIWLDGQRFDPQIYNEGEPHFGDPEERGTGGRLHPLRRLWRRLTGWLR